jgi:hypothetical protein
MPKSTRLGQIYVGIRAKIKDFKDDLKKARRSSERFADKTQRRFNRINLKKAGMALLSFRNALIATAGAYGLGRLSGSFLTAARTTENYQLRLNALLGSVEKGNRLFKEMAEFAGQVPYEFNEIMGAATQLSGVMSGGIEEIKQWMPLIADLAAVSGLGIRQTTEQVIRMYSAGAASADLFRERGITAMLGFQAGVSYSAEETRAQLMKAFEDPESKFKGATKEMAKSWDGMMSMIADKWFQFRNMIMEAGVYDYLKARLKEINEGFGKWIKNNEDFIQAELPKYLDDIAKALKTMGGAVKWVIDDIGDLFDLLEKFPKPAEGLIEYYRRMTKTGPAFKPLLPMLDEEEARQSFDRLYAMWSNTVDKMVDYWPHESPFTDRLLLGFETAEEKIDDFFRWTKKDAEEWAKHLEEQFQRPGHALDEELIQAYEDTEEALKNLKQTTSDTAKFMEEIWSETARNMQNAFSDFFYDAITGQLKTLEDYILSFANSMARTLSNILSGMLWQGIFTMFPMGGGGGGATGPSPGWWTKHGAAFGPQGKLSFAQGGVVDKPTIFPFASGVGMMGEAGPEAILPLTRTSGGDLGVKSEGSGNTIVMNINAMDSESFEDFANRNMESFLSPLKDAIEGGNRDIINPIRSIR